MSGIRLTVIRRGDALVPAAQMWLDELHKIPEGESASISWHRVRSLPHHRRFFAKLRKLCQAGAWDAGEDSLLSYLKLGIGYVHTVIDNSSSMVSGGILAIAEKMVAKYGPASDEGRLARFVISIAGPKSFLIPKSINFETLDQTAFGDFEKRSDEFFALKFGIAPEDLMREATDLAVPVVPDSEPQAPQVSEDASSRPAAANDAGEPSDALDARLRALADALEKDAPEACEAAWAEEWKRLETKRLCDEDETSVKAIVRFARMLAAGDLKGGTAGYKEMVGKIIAAAAARRAA